MSKQNETTDETKPNPKPPKGYTKMVPEDFPLNYVPRSARRSLCMEPLTLAPLRQALADVYKDVPRPYRATCEILFDDDDAEIYVIWSEPESATDRYWRWVKHEKQLLQNEANDIKTLRDRHHYARYRLKALDAELAARGLEPL